VFWHEYAKIPRHTSQNAITEGDFKCILARNCEGTEQLRNVKHIKVHHRPEVHLLRIRYEIITCFLWIALHLSMTVMPFFTDMPKNQASGFFAPSALFPFLCLLLFLKHPTNY